MAHPINPDIYTTPALEPPEGQSSNLVDPYSTNPHLIVTYSVCLTMVMIFIAIRTFTKVHVLKEPRVEDCQSPSPAYKLESL